MGFHRCACRALDAIRSGAWMAGIGATRGVGWWHRSCAGGRASKAWILTVGPPECAPIRLARNAYSGAGSPRPLCKKTVARSARNQGGDAHPPDTCASTPFVPKGVSTWHGAGFCLPLSQEGGTRGMAFAFAWCLPCACGTATPARSCAQLRRAERGDRIYAFMLWKLPARAIDS